MNIKSPENIKSPDFSLKQAGEMFSALFENRDNQIIVAELFKWLPWVAREQKVQETIGIAKSWLGNLKNTIV